MLAMHSAGMQTTALAAAPLHASIARREWAAITVSGYLRRIPDLQRVGDRELEALAFAFVERSFNDGTALPVSRRASIHLLLGGKLAIEPRGGRVQAPDLCILPGTLFALDDGAETTYRAAGRVRLASLSAHACSFLSQARAEVTRTFHQVLTRLAINPISSCQMEDKP